jgi:deoxyribodipyrimidine photo-lyase
MKSIFIFRRDYRLEDNISFIECYKNSDLILPIFIFTPEQTKNNEYFSSNSFQFLLECLHELDNELKTKYKSHLHYYYGDNIQVLKSLLKEYDYQSIYFNMDYTSYAQKRDKNIFKFCNDNNISCNMFEDYLLAPIGTYLKNDGKEYQKYTPFKNNAKKFVVEKPKYINYDKNKFDKIKYNFNLEELNKYYTINPNIAFHGGRKLAENILKNIKKFQNYENERNDLNIETTHLSAYIKFGCVSIREVYNCFLKNFGLDCGLISQLLWREFYYYLSYYNPHILENGKSLKEQYDKIKWNNNNFNIQSWCNGVTGFPIVDAGMNQMNITGFMHNRSRLITSGILIKILNCDWRIGEKYFAQKLIDYDPIVNNGNWQWSSGSGADSQPYFRILSPWKQTIDNDPNCEYIKKWIPQLQNVSVKNILKWDKFCNQDNNKNEYICPIVNYEIMRKEIINTYKDGLYK